jgi:hypothetical protein
MKEHPILFSAPMVRAILAGRKTQTRRVVAASNSLMNGSPCRKEDWPRLDYRGAWIDQGPSPAGNPGPYLKVPRPDDDTIHRVYSRKYPGDRLWVRESWQYCGWSEDGEPQLRYAADGAVAWPENIDEEWGERLLDLWIALSDPDNYNIDNHASDRRWRPSIHMPRWASRIALEVTTLRVERLQSISENDAIAEGVAEPSPFHPLSAKCQFQNLWDSINGAGAWDLNPWVWVLEFKRVSP